MIHAVLPGKSEFPFVKKTILFEKPSGFKEIGIGQGTYMVLRYNRELYTKTALLKASYHFTDNYYVYLDQDDMSYLVDIAPKTGPESPNIKGLFSNELLAQATREKVVEQTKHVRELLLGRAFSSTIIEDDVREEVAQSPAPVLPSPPAEQDENEIFKDWFMNHET